MTGRFHHRFEVRCSGCSRVIVTDTRTVLCAACESGETQAHKAELHRMAEKAVAATSRMIAEALANTDEATTRDVLQRTLDEIVKG